MLKIQDKDGRTRYELRDEDEEPMELISVEDYLTPAEKKELEEAEAKAKAEIEEAKKDGETK